MTAVQDMSYDKPVPKIEPEAAPYWEYLRQHDIHLQRCDHCEEAYFPPSTHCPACLSPDVTWTPVAGTGRVWATATMHRAYLEAYEPEIPYNISIVELDEGPKVWTNVVAVPVDDVRVGMRVSVRYDDVAEDLTLARFVASASQD